MNSLAASVREMNRLIQAGHTLEAMEQFYADDVIMRENEEAPRAGKAICLAHEKRMLASVTGLKATLHKQAIDEANKVVFSEWTYESTSHSGQQYLLTEVSVQQWQNELIQAEKLYYNKILKVL